METNELLIRFSPTSCGVPLHHIATERRDLIERTCKCHLDAAVLAITLVDDDAGDAMVGRDVGLGEVLLAVANDPRPATTESKGAPGMWLKVGVGSVDRTVVENFTLGRRRVAMFSDTGSGGVHDAQLLAVLDALPIAVMVRAADGSLLHANSATERFLARLGLDVSHVASSPTAMMDHIAVIDEHGHQQDRTRLPVVSAIRDGGHHEATLGYALPSGGWAWYATRAAPVALEDGTIGTVVTCDDVTRRRQLEEELRLAALVDPLTGLANRRALETALDDAQRRRARDGGHVGLLFLDLDAFKTVNDTLGHDAGDRVLVETGKRLLAATRAVDLVCRVGGDEFAVLCTWSIGPEGLQELITRIWALPPVSMLVDGEPLAVRGSIGAVLVEPKDRLDEALRRADAAMYRDKRGALDSLLVIG